MLLLLLLTLLLLLVVVVLLLSLLLLLLLLMLLLLLLLLLALLLLLFMLFVYFDAHAHNPPAPGTYGSFWRRGCSSGCAAPLRSSPLRVPISAGPRGRFMAVPSNVV